MLNRASWLLEVVYVESRQGQVDTAALTVQRAALTGNDKPVGIFGQVDRPNHTETLRNPVL